MAQRTSWDGEEDPGMIAKISIGYDKAWKTLIKPSRVQYSEESLGPPVYTGENGGALQRQDFTIQNFKNQKLECSMYTPLNTQTNQVHYQTMRRSQVGSYPEPKTCIFYLHSHSGCRVEGLFLRDYCAAQGYYLCLFDFAGCGLSEGTFVSLGHFEKRDAMKVIEYVIQKYGIGRVLLWGRSMGAVTSILLAEKLADKRHGTESPFFLSGLVLDSPFTRLTTMVEDVASNRINLPAIVTSIGMKIIKKTIIEKINFDITRLEPIDCAKKLTAPVAFILSEEDSMVPPKRIQEYLDAYGGKKKALYRAPGEHHSERLPELLDQVYKFVEGIFDQEAFNDVHRPRAVWQMPPGVQAEPSSVWSGFGQATTVPLKERDGSTGLKNSSFFDDRDRNMSRDKQVQLELDEKAHLAAFFENISQKKELPAISAQNYSRVRIFEDDVEDTNMSKLQEKYNFIEKFIGSDKLTQLRQTPTIAPSSSLIKSRPSPLHRQFGVSTPQPLYSPHQHQMQQAHPPGLSRQPPIVQPTYHPLQRQHPEPPTDTYTVPLKGGASKIRLATHIRTLQADPLAVPEENKAHTAELNGSRYHINSQLGVGHNRAEFFMAPADHNYKSPMIDKPGETSMAGGLTLGSIPTTENTRVGVLRGQGSPDQRRNKPEPSPPRESIGILAVLKKEFVTPLLEIISDPSGRAIQRPSVGSEVRNRPPRAGIDSRSNFSQAGSSGGKSKIFSKEPVDDQGYNPEKYDKHLRSYANATKENSQSQNKKANQSYSAFDMSSDGIPAEDKYLFYNSDEEDDKKKPLAPVRAFENTSLGMGGRTQPLSGGLQITGTTQSGFQQPHDSFKIGQPLSSGYNGYVSTQSGFQSPSWNHGLASKPAGGPENYFSAGGTTTSNFSNPNGSVLDFKFGSKPSTFQAPVYGYLGQNNADRHPH